MRLRSKFLGCFPFTIQHRYNHLKWCSIISSRLPVDWHLIVLMMDVLQSWNRQPSSLCVKDPKPAIPVSLWFTKAHGYYPWYHYVECCLLQQRADLFILYKNLIGLCHVTLLLLALLWSVRHPEAIFQQDSSICLYKSDPSRLFVNCLAFLWQASL